MQTRTDFFTEKLAEELAAEKQPDLILANNVFAHADDLDGIEFVRTLAAAKVMMPASVIRLSAGREQMTDEMQALCFLAGAGSIFVGEKLLTTANPETDADARLLERLGLEPAGAPQ